MAVQGLLSMLEVTQDSLHFWSLSKVQLMLYLQMTGNQLISNYISQQSSGKEVICLSKSNTFQVQLML